MELPRYDPTPAGRARLLREARWRFIVPGIVYFASAILLTDVTTLMALALALMCAGITAMAWTRHGSLARAIVQILLGLAALGLAALALASLGLSTFILAQGARGADLGFGGVFVLVGIPLGIGLGIASFMLGLMALGGPRKHVRAADGLVYTEPPALP